MGIRSVRGLVGETCKRTEGDCRLNDESFNVDADLAALDAWLESNGLEGYDPYDVLGHPVLGALHSFGQGRPRAFRAPHRLANDLVLRNSGVARRLLRTKPALNAKGLGLQLMALTILAGKGHSRAGARASEIVEVLLSLGTDAYGGYGWGYPFDWFTRVRIPTGTPSAVVTSTCGRALLDWAALSGNESARQKGIDSARFLAEGLRREVTSDGVCLSYTPLDDFAVHNANLMAAAHLLRAAQMLGDEEMAELAVKCFEFTVADQREDGAFEYWAPSQRTVSHIDNYHTGFVLRSLNDLAGLGVTEAVEPLMRGWVFYRDEMLPDEHRDRPLNSIGNASSVDIHTCAESVLCPVGLRARFPEGTGIALRAAEWTHENMRNDDGSFGYMWRDGKLDPTPYIRWGESWMFLALASLAQAGDDKC